ncbi:GNAT family N-acetyltransferase [Natronomonas sp. EA1]|uniref:GNAT family N-acetyltransferase n=1 Tax=Natronomonas sp. EA1 TaxID=3421655 RepID=UPI003EBD273C
MPIRPARSEDIDAIRAVTRAAWEAAYAGFMTHDAREEALEDGYDPEFLERVLEERDDLLFVVYERDGEVVGFASAQQTWADEVELHTLFVHPDHWEAGVGSELLGTVADSAEASGVDRIRAAVFAENYVGQGFLQAKGFEEIDEDRREMAGVPYRELVFERSI